MTALAALLVAQPVAFWLGVSGLLFAAALALGSPLAARVALATLLGALTAAAAPHAPLAQAAAAFIAGGAAAAWTLARRPPPPATPEPARPVVDEARLLGRTARARGAFAAGDGQVEVDGTCRPARTLDPAVRVEADALVRIVRVGETALVVRPLLPAD